MNSLLLLTVPKPIPGMENGQVIDILHIPLLKIRAHTEPFTQKVQGI